jgi:hypothetical protein
LFIKDLDSYNNKTDRHYIAEILLKVALNTITLKNVNTHCLLQYINGHHITFHIVSKLRKVKVFYEQFFRQEIFNYTCSDLPQVTNKLYHP